MGRLLFTLLASLVLAPAVCASERVDLAPSAVGTLHVDAVMGRAVSGEFLLDTGSAYVVLSAASRDRLEAEGALEHLRTLRAVMANNARVSAPVYRVSRLALSPHCVLTDVEAVALPGARKNILGLTALRPLAPFTIHLEPAQLELNCGPGAITNDAVASR